MRLSIVACCAALVVSSGCGDHVIPPVLSDLAPVNDVASVAEGSGATLIDVLANDTRLDGRRQAIASITQPVHGTAAIGLDGLSVSYTPASGYCNQAPNTPRDTFTYTLTPGGSSATVSVAVACACGLRKPTEFVVGSN